MRSGGAISRRWKRSSRHRRTALVVDKFPLHMAQIPLIHRIFPDARLIFVERHPCDAVLSCFMSNFQLNRAMRSFTDLEEAALTYDAVFDAWTRATTLLPVNVHRIRYERMVENLEAEMRPLLEFLGRALGSEGARQSRQRREARAYPHRQLLAGDRADLSPLGRALAAVPQPAGADSPDPSSLGGADGLRDMIRGRR